VTHSIATRAITLLGLVSCSGTTSPAPADDPAEVRAPAAIAFVDVRVVPMTDGTVLDHRTVIVRDGRVERIEPAGSSPLPGDVTVIEGRGRYLAPALIDMHVHLRTDDLAAYLRAGIGVVRNMWGHSLIPGMVSAIESGARLGPVIHSTSPGIDGSPPQWPETQLAGSAAEADDLVDSLATAGWRSMKVYQRLSAPVYDAILDATRRIGVTAVGHVPTAITVEHALSSGQHSIEHFSGYDRAISRQARMGTSAWLDVDESRFAALVQATLAAGTWNCPTMTIYATIANQHGPADRATIVTNRRRFLKALSDAGAGLLAGTDAGIDVVAPGTSMHDELAEFVAAGLTPWQALRAATADAGRYLEVPGLGTVSVGAPAQLMLLDANPLADVANAKRLAGIVVRGEWFSAARLAALDP
jgi:imidazolonepropionase-like amidohydrolase